jgi:hypothetical protein
MDVAVWGIACAGLACLFLVSAVALVILLIRRGRRNSTGA